MSDNIIHLVGQADGIPVNDLRDAMEFWTADPIFDTAKTALLVVETAEGNIRVVAQALGPLDGYRTVGLLNGAKHKIMHGNGFGL
jgi:hypothetical protein